MRAARLFLVALHVVCARGVFAEAIGMVDDRSARLGYAAGGSYVTVEDPAGTATALVAAPLSLVYLNRLGSDTRYGAELFYQEAAFDADPGAVGLYVHHTGISATLSRRVWWTDRWTPWLGVGLVAARDRYSERHRVDEDGFLVAVLPDRDETNLGIEFHLEQEWSIDHRWDVGARLAQVFSLAGGVNSLSLAAMLLYVY